MDEKYVSLNETGTTADEQSQILSLVQKPQVLNKFRHIFYVKYLLVYLMDGYSLSTSRGFVNDCRR